MTRPQIGEPLTPAELDVLRLAANGGTTASIGRALHVSEHTVNSRFKGVYDKLGVHDRPHAVALTLRLGILPAAAVDTSRYLAAVRDRSHRAEQALRAVRQLHRPSGDHGRQICSTCSRPELYVRWPCPTVHALTEAAA